MVSEFKANITTEKKKKKPEAFHIAFYLLFSIEKEFGAFYT